jgi:hypothetical protein
MGRLLFLQLLAFGNGVIFFRKSGRLPGYGLSGVT